MKIKLIMCILVVMACGQADSGPARPAPQSGVYIPTETQARVARVGDMLVGRVPGLEVRRSRNGLAHSYRIRGIRRLMGSEEPLLVLDGTPMPIAMLNSLSPRDIARVHVLRDTETSIYGIRGGNGVIVVTTKRPGN